MIAVALALLSYFSTNASPLVDLANTITSPFRAVCTSVSGWFTDKQNYYEDVTALKAENEALKKQIAEMEATVRQGEAASQENVFLRDLLDLRQQRRDLSDFETATVTERGVTNWTASLTLEGPPVLYGNSLSSTETATWWAASAKRATTGPRF